MKIHPTAIIESGARLGRNVEVGPYAYIGPEVRIGDECVIGHGCHIEGRVTMGRNNMLSAYVVLGTPPQDLKYHGQPTALVIGDDNVFREFVTVNIGTVTGAGTTRIGNRNYFMICSHVAHDCIVEDDVVMVNAALLGGHCRVESGAVLNGGAAANPFVTIGKRAYVGGLSRIVHDVPPFMKVEGHPARVRGVNEVGLQRAGYEQRVIDEVCEAYKASYRTKELNRSVIYDRLENDPNTSEPTRYLVQFLRRSRRSTTGRYLETLRKA